MGDAAEAHPVLQNLSIYFFVEETFRRGIRENDCFLVIYDMMDPASLAIFNLWRSQNFVSGSAKNNYINVKNWMHEITT